MKRFKVEALEAPYRAKLEQALQARVTKVEDELGTRALERVLAEHGYPGSRGRAQSNEKLPAETKRFGAEADQKLPAEGQLFRQ
jgi:hypothetical protein